MLELVQTALWCSCGNSRITPNGKCDTCARRDRLSREDFGGLRDDVLERDGFRGQCCGAIEDLIVHHRRPGRNARRLLITLCRGCHARVERTLSPRYSFPDQLRELWREVHPERAEQLCLALSSAAVIDLRGEQPALFEAAA